MARKVNAPVFFGNGAPTASTGPKGSIYIRLDGGSNTTLYVREAAGAVAQATAILTLTGNATNNQTVTIGGVVYTFKTTLSVGPAVPYEVKIGAAATNTIDNLIAAINGSAGAGTNYGTGTVAHPLVTAAAGAGDTMDLTAKALGPAGNGIVLAETLSAGSWNRETTLGGTFDTGSGWVAK